MELNRYTEAFAALSHPGRMELFRLLVRRHPDALQPSEIAECLRMRRNTLSTHLTVMKRARLITTLREGRGVFCQIDVEAIGDLVHFLTADCCRGRPDLCGTPQVGSPYDAPLLPATDERPLNVLFLCTRNSARSIFAESILSQHGGDAFRAFSAGTAPQSEVNTTALDLLRRMKHPIDALHPKHVSVFRSSDAPRMDFVFTVCDRAANEDCPPWPGAALSAHWGVPDPIAETASPRPGAMTFGQAFTVIEERITAFLALPLRSLERHALQLQLDAIGRA